MSQQFNGTQEQPQTEGHIRLAYANLMSAGEHDLAAALKAKHPEIWPVDYAAIVLEKAVAFSTKRTSKDGSEVTALHEAVRNYLTDNKE